MVSTEVLLSNPVCGNFLAEVSEVEAFVELVSEIETIIIAERDGETVEEGEQPPEPARSDENDDKIFCGSEDDDNDNFSDGGKSCTFSDWFPEDDDTNLTLGSSWNDDTGNNQHEDAETFVNQGWCSEPPTPLQHCANIADDWNSTENRLQDIKVWSSSNIAKHFANAGTVVPENAVAELQRLELKAHLRMKARRSTSLRAQRLKRSILVDTQDKLVAVLDRLSELDLEEPQIVIDCEGFSKEGSIDIMELFVLPDDTLFFIDINTLRESTWCITASTSTFCLRGFLTTTRMKKIMWDLRMDAHFLKKLYDIRLAGVVDGSLWTVAYRIERGQRHPSTRFSIETACKEIIPHKIDAAELQSMLDAKENRSSLPFRPWRIRPLPDVLIDYAADVKYMGIVYQVLRQKLKNNPHLTQLIEDLTEQELEVACSQWWPAWSDKGASSPWSGDYFESWKQRLDIGRENAILDLLDALHRDTPSASKLRRLASNGKDFVKKIARRVSKQTTTVLSRTNSLVLQKRSSRETTDVR